MAPDPLALNVRRIANSTRTRSAAATRQPPGWRPVQVSRVLSRPGETHSPGTYVVSGDLCSGASRVGLWLTRPLLDAQPVRRGRSGSAKPRADQGAHLVGLGDAHEQHGAHVY